MLILFISFKMKGFIILILSTNQTVPSWVSINSKLAVYENIKVNRLFLEEKIDENKIILAFHSRDQISV